MKRCSIVLMVGALCAAMFASPAVPSEWDPNYPPPTPYMHNDQHTGNGDETPWDEPIHSPGIVPDDWVIPIWHELLINHLWIKFINPPMRNDLNHQIENNGTDNGEPEGNSSIIGK